MRYVPAVLPIGFTNESIDDSVDLSPCRFEPVKSRLDVCLFPCHSDACRSIEPKWFGNIDHNAISLDYQSRSLSHSCGSQGWLLAFVPFG